MTALIQISSSQPQKEVTANENFAAVAPVALFARKYSASSGLTWGYYGGYMPVNGAPTSIADGTVTLLASRTSQVEAGFVSNTTAPISGITLANPCVVTSTAHPYAIGDVLYMSGIAGMTQLNGTFARVTAVTANTVTINVNSSAFTAWSSGGTLQRVTTTGATTWKVGTGLDIGNAFVAPMSLYQVVTSATGVTSYTDYRLSNLQYEARLTKSVAGSANVTLTQAEAQNNILEFTGALTGNINVVVPPVTDEWTVYNNTSGAFTLTIKTPAGTGITVRQGKREIVYGDGTNIVGAVEGVTQLSIDAGGDFAVGHTITVPGTTGNQTINKLAGRVNIAATGTTVTVTNSLVTANSHVFCSLVSNDASATIKNVVPAAGSFTINLGAAATAEVAISFFVVNGF